MNPFYFGSRDRRLFGIYHPATGRPVRSTGIVICPPILLESMRTRRLLKHFSVELAERGFHVLRFDYHGTGDSGGTGGEEDLEGWVGDARTAVRELADLTAVSRTTLVGMRFGAVVAARAAHASGPLDDLVLWDPVVAGRSYLRWLLRRAVGSNGSRPPSPEQLLAGLESLEEPGPLGVDGFPVSLRLLRDIGAEELNRMSLGGLPVRRVVVAASPGQEVSFFLCRLEREGVEHAARSLPDDTGWEDAQRLGSVLFAPRTIRELVDNLASARD